MSRTTKASNAILRLKQRSQNEAYSMVSMSDGRFYLVMNRLDTQAHKLSEPLEIDEFVRFVNQQDKAAPKKISKLDIAFESKLLQSKCNLNENDHEK